MKELERGKTMGDLPKFPAWDRATLDRFAADSYIRMQQQADAIEQLRQDLRDAMNLLRRREL
jgi:hypothetical protein